MKILTKKKKAATLHYDDKNDDDDDGRKQDDSSDSDCFATDSRLKRNGRRDRRRSVKHKRMKKETKYWVREDELLLTHIPYGGDTTKTPHILINKWFHRLKKNCIVLKNPRENNDKSNRKIFYDIDFIGENVKYVSTKKFINFQMHKLLNSEAMFANL